jgi:hypothetical protein
VIIDGKEWSCWPTNWYASFGMIGFNIRSVTASALSVWLGVLACLLGCATPTKAAHRHEAGAVCPDRGTDPGESCCQYGHNPGSSEKNRHHAMSCCPTETALTQKQNLTLPALAVFLSVLTPVDIDAPPFDLIDSRLSDTVPWQTGRDILQQLHILRI